MKGKFLKSIPLKLYLILAAIVLLSFFSNDFGLVDIQKTAIILAAGIDKTGETFTLTAQIAVPKGSDRTTGGTSSVEIETEGETVSDCVSLLFAETGWVPKLVFCNLIVLGEEAVHEDVIAYLNYFLRNDYMPDSCLLAVCEGKAGKLISSASAIDDASSLAIEKLFSDAAEKSGRVMICTMKDFAIGYYGVSKSGYLPFLRMKEQSENESAGAESNSSNGSEPRETEPQMIYCAEETALFYEGKMVGLLSPEETLAFALVEGNVFNGTINAKDGEVPVTLTVVKDKGNCKLDFENGSPVCTLSVKATLRLCCRGVTAAIGDIATDRITPEIQQSAEEVLNNSVRSLWEKAQNCGSDVFFLKRKLYRSSLKKYGEWKENFFEGLTVRVEVQTVSVK